MLTTGTRWSNQIIVQKTTERCLALALTVGLVTVNKTNLCNGFHLFSLQVACQVPQLTPRMLAQSLTASLYPGPASSSTQQLWLVTAWVWCTTSRHTLADSSQLISQLVQWDRDYSWTLSMPRDWRPELGYSIHLLVKIRAYTLQVETQFTKTGASQLLCFHDADTGLTIVRYKCSLMLQYCFMQIMARNRISLISHLSDCIGQILHHGNIVNIRVWARVARVRFITVWSCNPDRSWANTGLYSR